MFKWEQIVNRANVKHGYPPPTSEGEFGKEFDKLVYETFSTTYGKELLNFLEKNLLMKPIWNPSNPEVNSYFMEGRNNLVRLFIKRKEAYKNGETNV